MANDLTVLETHRESILALMGNGASVGDLSIYKIALIEVDAQIDQVRNGLAG
jgi:hypothetical protein